tara:strand:+ start:9427 stop:9996 length:570 start_codon:yes stop_codon:yes gene_type:complete
MSLTETMKREHIQEAVENDISMQTPKRIEDLDFQHVQDFVENAPIYVRIPKDKIPQSIGDYLWKTKVEDFDVVFSADVFNFGAYTGNVFAPRFKYWDGYTTLLPNIPLAWAKQEESHSEIFNDRKVIKVLNQELACCPFCKTEPTIEFDFRANIPNRANSFNMKCCKWNNKPRFKTLRELISEWNNALK